MNDLAYAGVGGRLHQRPGVGDGAIEIKARVRETNPVGVVEDVGSSKGRREALAVLELQGLDLDLLLQIVGARSVRVVGQRADPSTILEQPARDVPAGVAESARHRVDGRAHRR